MDYPIKFQKLCQIGIKSIVFVVGVVAATYLLCQSLLLSYGNALIPLLPEIPLHRNYGTIAQQVSTLYGVTLHEVEIRHDGGSNPSTKGKDMINELEPDARESNMVFDLIENGVVDKHFEFGEVVELEETSPLQIVTDQDSNLRPGKLNGTANDFFLDQSVEPYFNRSKGNASNRGLASDQIKGGMIPSRSSAPALIMDNLLRNDTSLVKFTSRSSILISPAVPERFHAGNLEKHEKIEFLHVNVTIAESKSTGSNDRLKNKTMWHMPPKTIMSIYEMNHRLVHNRATARAMRPRWSSERDKEILAAKLQIESAPTATSYGELYRPLFRNVSMFRKSYELMERILKVYVYREGNKPIFHQPVLKGLYASEGWFMKLMEGNKQFTVEDPRKAHLFYMPFSSRMLQYSLYVPNSYNRTHLRQYLKKYSETIAAKYRFWNRTGGADHFLVACHDWAPYETRHHMEHCIKALCNADVTLGFKIGRDVSLPETYVRSGRNPLRDIGGKPPSERHILAFFAGNIHGYLRPILLKHWEKKDPDMKIFGPMPHGVARKMGYVQHMKRSKYCICPKGYEVNSPRVVEAIYYECVPVIISDNFVPPFFEVLDWGAFSVLIAEKDIPNLKDILLAIPKERYLEMQLRVKKVQQHFLWHAKPTKYDFFYMTLHSIWYNRVFQIKHR